MYLMLATICCRLPPKRTQPEVGTSLTPSVRRHVGLDGIAEFVLTKLQHRGEVQQVGLHAGWDIPLFMSNNIVESAGLTDVLTLSGILPSVKACTCQVYMELKWHSLGLRILSLINKIVKIVQEKGGSQIKGREIPEITDLDNGRCIKAFRVDEANYLSWRKHSGSDTSVTA
jgi:hypothetical protein